MARSSSHAQPALPGVAPRVVAQLLLDVERYLAAVDVFRAEGIEPTWRAA